MLVLSRKIGERIQIGENIEMTIVSIRGDRVRLGFRAPDDVAINRCEVHQRIQKPNQEPVKESIEQKFGRRPKAKRPVFKRSTVVKGEPSVCS